MAQVDVKLIGSTVESIVIEFDQGKLDEFHSLGSKSPKATWLYHRASSETCSQVFSETPPKAVCTIAHNASSVMFSEVLKTSRVAHRARINVSQEAHRASMLAHIQNNDEGQSRHLSPPQTQQFQIAQGSQQPPRLNQNAEHRRRRRTRRQQIEDFTVAIYLQI